MATAESSSVIVFRRRLSARRRVVVWVRGEHDVSTVDALSETLAAAMARDDRDVVVDMSEVQFMGAATVGVLVRARVLLESRSRSLVLRSPSGCAQRMLDLCGQGDLLGPRRADVTPAGASEPDPSSAADQVPVSRITAATVASADSHHRAEERTADPAGRGAP